jgi:L-ascorbate metabolism protein UlaG (beta-lactamase superfamily)
VASFEICEWLKSKGVANTVGMNKGGTVSVAGIQATMVHAVHSCGISDGDRIVYGGEAAGFVLGVDGGFSIYHAGDTDVFSDMQLIGELYEPDVAFLPIGGHFTMGPREAARACRLLGVSRVVPMHFGTFPLLAGTPDELRVALEMESPRCQVLEARPGVAF